MQSFAVDEQLHRLNPSGGGCQRNYPRFLEMAMAIADCQGRLQEESKNIRIKVKINTLNLIFLSISTSLNGEIMI